MVEKNKKTEIKKTSHHSGGISFGMEILLFVVVIFVLWVLTGGAKKETQQSPLLVPDNSQIIPTNSYGSTVN